MDEPVALAFDDYFADENGERSRDMPVSHMSARLDGADGEPTRMTIVTRFESLEQLKQLEQMGMEQGMREAVSQIDSLLSA